MENNSEVAASSLSEKVPAHRYGTLLNYIKLIAFVCCTQSALFAEDTILGQYLIHRISIEQNFVSHNHTSLCNKNDSYNVSVQRLQDKVNQDAATISMFASFLHGLPILVVSPFLGAYSDELGRKKIMFVPLMGIFAYSILNWFFIQFNAPLSLFYVAHLLRGLVGGFETMFLGIYSFIADTSSGRKLSTVQLVLNGFLSLTLLISQVVIERTLTAFDFFPPFVGATIVIVLSFVPLCALPETSPKVLRNRLKKKKTAAAASATPHNKQNNQSSPFNAVDDDDDDIGDSGDDDVFHDPQTIAKSRDVDLVDVTHSQPNKLADFKQRILVLCKDVVNVLKSDIERAKIIALVLVVFCFASINTSSFNDVAQVYTFSQPFCWNATEYGNYTALYILACEVGMLIVIFSVQYNCATDEAFIIAGLFSGLISRTVLGLASIFSLKTGTIFLYLSLPPVIFVQAGVTSIRASYSKLLKKIRARKWPFIHEQCRGYGHANRPRSLWIYLSPDGILLCRIGIFVICRNTCDCDYAGDNL